MEDPQILMDDQTMEIRSLWVGFGAKERAELLEIARIKEQARHAKKYILRLVTHPGIHPENFTSD